MRIHKADRDIMSLESWFELAPPKGGEGHWKDGRSAKELARAWVASGTPAVPAELTALLHSHPDLRGVEIESVEPEARVGFDRRAGERRNADLAIRGNRSGEVIAISVEAKADESFGALLHDALVDALEARVLNPRSAAFERIQDVVLSILPGRGGTTQGLDRIRYQLLTGCAGALAQASGLSAAKAVFIVHEFRSASTSAEAIKRNANDLDAFVARLTSGKEQGLTPGRVIGPIALPGDPLFPEPPMLYIGKIVTTL